MKANAPIEDNDGRVLTLVNIDTVEQNLASYVSYITIRLGFKPWSAKVDKVARDGSVYYAITPD